MYKKINGLIVLFLLLLYSPISVSAQQRYIGDYFDQSTVTTSLDVIFSADFTNSALPPAGYFESGIISSATGYDTSTLSGNMYQNQIGVLPSGSISWVPQIWQTGVDNAVWITQVDNVGTYDMPRFYGRMTDYYSSGNYKVSWAIYVYETQADITNDTPTVTTRQQNCWSGVNDRYFIVGYRTDTVDEVSNVFKFTQSGIEAGPGTWVPTNNWEIKIDHFGYKLSNGYWHYDGAKSVRGAAAYITHSTTQWMSVGGSTLKGTINSSGADYVTWQKDTTSTANGVTVWSATGTPSTPPSVPFT